MRYEWRGYEEEPEDWHQLLRWLLNKYEGATGDVVGLESWRHLVERLIEPLSVYMESDYRAELADFPDEDQLREYSNLYEQLLQIRNAYDRFLAAIQRINLNKLRNVETGQITRCLFISHRQCDHRVAKRVSYIAEEHSYDYWLDIEDPSLTAITSIQGLMPATVKAILIAGTIEIGLLNSTHVIALLSKNAAGSQWIPYEYGRAKSGWPFQKYNLWSPNAAAWIQSTVNPPEYSYLANVLRTERGLRNWLGTPRNPLNCASATRGDCLDQ